MSLEPVERDPIGLYDDVVELLEDALARARAGQLRSVAIAALTADRLVMTAATEDRDHAPLVGAVAMLQHDLITNPNREG